MVKLDYEQPKEIEEFMVCENCE